MKHTSEHNTPLEHFSEVLRQLTDVVNDLAQIEGQKAQAAAYSQHHLINGFLNPEQAQILKLRGLEQKRMKFAEELGWKGLTFRQILEQADNEQKELLSPLFAELDREVKRLTSAKDSADRAIKLRLRELETAITLESHSVSGGQAVAGVSNHFKDTYV